MENVEFKIKYIHICCNKLPIVIIKLTIIFYTNLTCNGLYSTWLISSNNRQQINTRQFVQGIHPPDEWTNTLVIFLSTDVFTLFVLISNLLGKYMFYRLAKYAPSTYDVQDQCYKWRFYYILHTYTIYHRHGVLYVCEGGFLLEMFLSICYI